jgi:hypothetical protein
VTFRVAENESRIGIWGLVLGILGPFSCGLTAIPGIVCSVIGIRRKHHLIFSWLGLVIGIWFLGKVAGLIFLIPHPWGPEVRGSLPMGGFVIFQSRIVGRETDDRLTWIRADGQRQEFWVDRIHAGFEYVTIRLRDNGKGVWVEAYGKVGASLDLTTGEFRAEHDPQFEWAVFGKGEVIGAGRTWSIMSIFLPW